MVSYIVSAWFLAGKWQSYGLGIGIGNQVDQYVKSNKAWCLRKGREGKGKEGKATCIILVFWSGEIKCNISKVQEALSCPGESSRNPKMETSFAEYSPPFF